MVAKEECCGCMACLNICPQRCIEEKRDLEGFSYPFVNKKECSGCGLCSKVCPAINYKKLESNYPDAYIFQNGNNSIRNESTSGGAFTAIASYVIQNYQGKIYGVAFDEKWRVKHMLADKIKELSVFRGSKYVQSEMGETYKSIKELIKQMRKVNFLLIYQF